MIPKLIHQTARTAELSEQCQVYQTKLQALHPDWHYRLWTDEDNLTFVRSEFPDLLDVYNRLPKNIMRADMIRYLLVYRFGGLYLDTDFEMLKPFDLLQYDCVLPWESSGEHGRGKDRICNSIFAAAPNHPFFRMVIDELKTHPPLDPDIDVIDTTGPVFFTSILRRLTENQITEMNIFLPPRPLFSPPTPRTPREYQAILNADMAYGIHHCHGTWRHYSLPQRVRNRIVRWVRRLV